MIRLAFKAGLAGTAIYYINQQGVWRKSDESVETYEKIKSSVTPYIQEIKAQLPFKLPELPQANRPSYVIKEYWNKGVLTTFEFLINAPKYTKEYTRKGVDVVMEHHEFKNFLNMLSGKTVETK